MAGWLHGFFCEFVLVVLPFCGISLSLCCDYSYSLIKALHASLASFCSGGAIKMSFKNEQTGKTTAWM